VVDHARRQKGEPSAAELLAAFAYYLRQDAFIDFSTEPN
jgi:hypothetical protein